MHIYAGDGAFGMAKFLPKTVMLWTYRRASILKVQGVIDQRSGPSAGPDVRPALFYLALSAISRWMASAAARGSSAARIGRPTTI